MKTRRYVLPAILFFLILSFFSGSTEARNTPPPLSGIKYIGSGAFTQSYATLTAAFADITANSLGGNITLVLQSGYTSSGESFPITTPAAAVTGSYSVTVYPDAAGRSISGNSATGLIILNGSRNIVIDGRVNGTGNTKSLIIENTNSSAPAIQFINDAFSNTVKYATVKGVAASNTVGVINFSTTTGTTGNNNNVIDNCDIADGATTPATGIYSLGTASKENRLNTVSNCNIYNFFSATVSSSGIFLSSNNAQWTISGNNFYQSAGRTATTGNLHYGIQISSTTGGGFNLLNNSIGGSQALCGGTAWTILGTVASRFVGVLLATSITAANSVQGNTIKNFNLSTSSNASANPGIWCGIYLNTANANIGTETGNTIGSSTGNASVTTTTSGAGGTALGIAIDGSTSVVNISNNSIGSISAGVTAATVSSTVIAINSTGCTNLTINNNLIGSTVTTNSLWATNTGAGTTGQAVLGIVHSAALTALYITNNTIAGLRNSYTGTAGVTYLAGVKGIHIGNGLSGGSMSTVSCIPTVTGNTIFNLSNDAPNPSGGAFCSLVGVMLFVSPQNADVNVSRNTIHTLISTSATTPGGIIGIYLQTTNTSAGYQNNIMRNNVHSLIALGTGYTDIRGLDLTCNTNVNCQNNMVRLGLDTSGAPLSGAYYFYGIFDNVNRLARYYNNSVYIGGTGVGDNGLTYAFFSQKNNVTREYRNNIFVNERSNGTGTGKHYALSIGGSTVNPSGLTMNNNLYYSPGTGGMLGKFNSTDYSTLSAWQTATGLDANSVFANPNFINPAGSASTFDLHLSAVNPAESAGTDLGVTDDYDGETRSSLTPVDLGADAGNFTANDLVPPAFSFTPITNTVSTANRTISVTITENFSGVPVTGSLVPRIWFRRVTPSATAWGSAPGTLTSGTSNSGVWSFTINYSLIGITPAAGDSIQYYFVAQDQAGTPNIGFNTPGGATHTNVNTQTAAPTNPVGYKIVSGLATTLSVGPGQTYTTLTGSGGLFQALNTAALTGNTTVSITGNLSEPGTYELISSGLGGYSLTIQPSAASVRIISNSANIITAMILLNGVSGVTIDGRFGGSGQYLRFVNTNTLTFNCRAAIEIYGSSTNTTIRNCILETNNTTSGGIAGTITIGAGANTGITIRDNDIRDAQGSPGTVGIPYWAVYSASLGNVVSMLNNNIYNFVQMGARLDLIGDQCVVTGNSFYYNNATTSLEGSTAIYIGSGSDHTVSNNYIGGKAPNCGGSAWVNGVTTNPTTNPNFIGVQLVVGNKTATSVQGNIIQNISLTGTAGANFYGILVSNGAVNIGTVSGNVIGHASTANSILSAGGSVSAASLTIGISIAVGAGTTVISNNTVANMHNTATSALIGVVGISNASTALSTISGNTVYSLSSTASTIGAQAAPVGIISSSLNSSQVISGNTIYNLSNLNTSATSPLTSGISINTAIGKGIITGNRVYNLAGSGTTVPIIAGIYTTIASGWIISNNMISLSGGSNTNNALIAGVYEGTQAGINGFYYNSIYVYGSTGAQGNTYCFLRQSTGKSTLRNNVFYNIRTAGTGVHFAIGNINTSPSLNWGTGTSNYNLYVTTDSTRIGEWGSAFYRTLSQWQVSSGGDANSRAILTTALSASNLFLSAASGNLKVDTSKTEKSFLNNYGTPIAAVTTDFYGVTRSTYAPDLGADEFSPAIYINPWLRLTALVEGIYNTGSNTMIADTMKVYLRRTTNPYTIVDSSRVLLSTAGQGVYTFTKTIRDSSFYLQLYNKRALETWSKTGVLFNADTVNYDFTTAANKAYGDNQVLRGTKYCLYSGDVNGDGVIDFSDLIQIDNDNANFVTGESTSDLNGDGVVDLTDLLLADNNNANFISRVTPLISKRVINPRPVKVLQQ